MRHRPTKLSARLLCGGAAAALAILSGAAAAQAAEPINIAPQPLSSALREFASQSQQAILVAPDLADAKVSPGVSNTADPEIALAQLLSGTGLTFRRSGDAMLIVQAGEGASPQGASAAGDVEALVVTAQKREENIQDVPIAISAFSQKALEEQKIEGGFDLLKAIPNVTFSKNNFTSYNFSIRGIGTKAVSPTTDPGVAVEFNDTPMIRNRLFEQEYFDVERVEVLRGPQGTLHGRNATSGVINVISAKPRLDEFQASMKIEGGNYNAQRAVGMINVPVIEGMLGVRVAASMTKRDGYGINLYDNSAADGRDLWSARTTIGFEPGERFRADLIWEHFQEDDNRQRTSKQLCTRDPGPTTVGGVSITNPGYFSSLLQARSVFSQGCLPGSLYADAAFGTPNGLAIPFINALATVNAGHVGYYPASGNTEALALLLGVDPYGNTTQSRDLRAIYSKIPSTYRADADVFELNMNFDLTDTLTITSQTAYNEDEIYASQDYNRYTTFTAFTDTTPLLEFDGTPSPFRNLMPGGFFCDPQLGCADTIVGKDVSRADSTQFSQELRLQSSFDGPVNFSLGANYLKYETVEDYYVFFNGITLASIVAINASGLGGSHAPDRLTANPDCSYQATDVVILGNVYCVPIEQNSIENIQDTGHNYFLSRNPYKLESKSVFGEVYWDVQESLKFTLGLRYSDDEKTFTVIPSQAALTPRDFVGLQNSPFGPTLIGAAFVGTGFGYPAEPPVMQGWQEVSGRIGLDWKPDLPFTDETMVYGFFSRGYKGGGMNPPPIGFNYEDALAVGIIYAPSAPPNFRPEFVNAYEIGTKNTLLSGAMILNLGAFYYDYKDYQVSKIVDRSAQNENFDAQIWGLELESIFSPTRNLRFNASLGYLNTRIGDNSLSIDIMNRTAGHSDWVLAKPALTHSSNCIMPTRVAALILGGGGQNTHELIQWACPGGNLGGQDYSGNRPFGSTLPDGTYYDPADYPEANYGTGFFTDISGNDLPNAPHWTAMVGSQYRITLPGGWDATVRGDFYWQSQSYARVYNIQYDKLHAWTNANLSLWFENPDWGIKAEVYVKNILDVTPITDAFLNSDDSALTTNVFTLDPRLIGVSIRKDF